MDKAIAHTKLAVAAPFTLEFVRQYLELPPIAEMTENQLRELGNFHAGISVDWAHGVVKEIETHGVRFD